MGIRDHPTTPQPLRQNGHVERLIGSIRRECLDHFIVLGEAHLGRILKAYASYHNKVRTHLALNKDATAFRLVQHPGSVTPIPIFRRYLVEIKASMKYDSDLKLRLAPRRP